MRHTYRKSRRLDKSRRQGRGEGRGSRRSAYDIVDHLPATIIVDEAKLFDVFFGFARREIVARRALADLKRQMRALEAEHSHDNVVHLGNVAPAAATFKLKLSDRIDCLFNLYADLQSQVSTLEAEHSHDNVVSIAAK